MNANLRLAYITTHYPALSHTFILREVAALRQLGAEIHTISLRRSGGEHLLSQENRDASRTTYAIRPPRWRDLLAAHLRALLGHPRAYVGTLHEAMRLARPGAKGALWQIFYFGEAVIVWHRCAAVGIPHIHAHHGSPPADVALLAAHFGDHAGLGPRTWSLTMHGSVEFWNVRWFRLEEKLKRALAVVCISDFARSQLMALLDEDEWSKLHIVHCGVVPGEYQGLPQPAPGRPRVLCVGRFVPEKGHAILVKALGRLRQLGHDAELVLVGSGPGQAQLEKLAATLGLGANITFAGSVGQDQIRQYYADASVFCLPSFAEGVPVVLMEAMASERPVVASAVGGVRELVRDGETGLLVTPGRADELARAITRLLDSPELYARLASAGQRHVSHEFDIERSAIQLDQFFRDISRPRDRLGADLPPAEIPTSDGRGLGTPGAGASDSTPTRLVLR